MKNKQKNYLIYQITNLINNHIYIGAHITYNINDKYLGSSKYLKKDIKLLGKNNFKKEILFVFNTKEEMIAKEAELVNKEFCHRIDTYNKMRGGILSFSWANMVVVKDILGNIQSVYNDDPRYLSGELFGIAKGNQYSKNLVSVKDKEGNTFSINKNDERYLNGELVSTTKGKVMVKDKDNNHYLIDITDPKYLNGELIPNWKDKNHKQESKDKIGKASSIHQKGELNSMYGKHHTAETKELLRDKFSLVFYVYDKLGNYISEEKGINEYAKKNKLNQSHIVQVLKGNRKSTGNLKFYYNKI